MAMNQALLGEWDHEMANTRKTLERVPEDKFDWTPHPKSSKMIALAQHLTEMPGWAVDTIGKDSLSMDDFTPPPPVKSRKELLAAFDKSVADGRKALAGATDQQLMQNWSLIAGGKALITLPKVAVVRTFILNHSIHHRAQLGVYLRLNNVPVPSIYGPSADENPWG